MAAYADGVSRTRPPAAAILVMAMTAAASAQGEFPDAWYYYGSARPAALRAMEGRPAPPLQVGNWIGTPPTLEGRVVVVDFWGTWCAPCLRAVPKNNQLVEKLGNRGVVVLGVHDAGRGWGKVPQIARQYGISYPIALDRGGASARAFHVRFWPTYTIIDRDGIVRAAGVEPHYVESVVLKVLGDAGAPPQPPIEEQYTEGDVARRRRLADLLAEDRPPPIVATDWTGGGPLVLDDLKGKVVLIDFWSVARSACVRELRQSAALHEQYAREGLVIIAVAHSRGADRVASLAGRLDLPFAVCVDDDLATIHAYRVDNYPDRYLIDRSGRLRIADCKDELVEEAVLRLLAEPAPEPDGDEAEDPAAE